MEGAEPGAAPLDAVLEPEAPADGLAKCLPLFTAGSGHRRFIRTLKPMAGSSFKARPQTVRQLSSQRIQATCHRIGWLRSCMHSRPCGEGLTCKGAEAESLHAPALRAERL